MNTDNEQGDEASFGGSIPGAAEAAFRVEGATRPALPVLIAVPHAGRCYPQALLQRMRDPDYTVLRLEDRLVDLLAKEIARETGAPLIVAHAPRAMIDLNRADDDMDWNMVLDAPGARANHSRANRRARSGLGLIPRRLTGLGEIWRDRHSNADVAERIASVHEPYHRAVSETLSAIRRVWGAALLLDLHSMPPLRKRHADDRPAEFVIGDRFGASSDGMLSAAALSYLARQGRSAAHNRPYAGGYVLDRHGKPSLAIHAMQLEVCRSLYLDARHEQVTRRMPALARLLSGLVRELAAEVVPPARERNLPLAAE
ncbi:N-formylglutamate amidohydrolase [Parerythrobacter aurantius]|uniref:N-formylglutamate amidohydrolase n=1 Tax=Parerythrobacter aurantius TaxID=3127706 RepID=UPI00324DDDED